jgi:RNA polymerase sigma-70 factor (ECF subfamily)
MTTILQESIQLNLSASPDQQILAKVAQGDVIAFEQLYRQYSKPIYRYLVRLVLDENVAEDLIQDVYIAAWTGARNFRGQASVKTWLYQIAHHQAVTWLRRRKINEKYDDSDRSGSAKSVEEKYFDTWMREQVLKAVDQLSVEHRSVIELVFYQGMSYQEAAMVMRCPVGTIKSRMSYARRYLDSILKSLKINDPESTD